MYKNATEFCALTLHPVIVLNSFIGSNILLVDPLGYPIHAEAEKLELKLFLFGCFLFTYFWSTHTLYRIILN